MNSLGVALVILSLIGLFASGCEQPPDYGSDGILLEYVGTLGETRNEDGALYGLRSVVFDSRDRAIVVAADNHDGMPFVLEADGSFVRVLSKPGAGPGELQSPDAVHVDANDSLFVWDRGTGRISVFGPDLEYTRTYPVEGYAGGTAVRLGSGDWLHGSSRMSGFPFLLYGSNGELIRAWGDSADYIEPANGMPMRHSWIAGKAPEGGAWLVKTSFRAVAVGIDSLGDEVTHLDIDPDWYQSYDRPVPVSPDSPPQTRLFGIHEDGAGLWIIGGAVDPEWRSALGDSYRAEGQTLYRIDDPVRLADGVIELRNPSDGTLLARYRDDRILWPARGGSPNLVYLIRRDDLGFQILDVYRLRYDPDGTVEN